MQNRRKPIRFKIVKFLLIVLIPFLLIVGFLKYFQIRDIGCKSQFNKCNSELENKLNQIEKGNLVKTKNALFVFLSKEVMVKKFSVQLRLDGKMQIYVEERVPIYCLKSGEHNYYADETGVVVKDGVNMDFGCIEKNETQYILGDTFSESDLNMFTLHRKLRNISEKENPRFENGNLIVEYKGKVKLIFPIDGDIELSAGKAYYIVSQFDKIEEYIINRGMVGLSEVDFRFKNPVVRII